MPSKTLAESVASASSVIDDLDAKIAAGTAVAGDAGTAAQLLQDRYKADPSIPAEALPTIRIAGALVLVITALRNGNPKKAESIALEVLAKCSVEFTALAPSKASLLAAKTKG